MKPTVRSMLTVALALALAAGGSAFAAGSGSDAPKPDDAAITAAVKLKLLDDERTDGFDVNVDTVDGRVTLRGGADSAAAREAATQLALGVDGVRAVDNRLTVATDGTETRQEANEVTASGKAREVADETTDEVDDAWITSKVKAKLLADTEVSGLAIDVDTEDNVVKLTGSVPSPKARSEAIRIATQTKGVLRVDASRLVVR